MPEVAVPDDGCGLRVSQQCDGVVEYSFRSPGDQREAPGSLCAITIAVLSVCWCAVRVLLRCAHEPHLTLRRQGYMSSRVWFCAAALLSLFWVHRRNQVVQGTCRRTGN